MKSQTYAVLWYFATYCKSVAKGWNDLADAMLNALRDHGYDVKKIDGKLCLVENDGGEDEKSVECRRD